MRSWLNLGLILLLIIGTPTLLAAKGDAAAGKTVFTGKCATCHGASGEGKESIAKMMKVEMRHLGCKEVQSKKDAELQKMIAEGGGKMKPVKLSDAEVANVIAFIRTLKK